MNFDGSLKSVGYEQKVAPAEGATAALADAAGQLGAAFDPTARLQAGTSYLKALKDQCDPLEALKVAAADPVADETSALGAETTLLAARAARCTADVARGELRSAQGR